MSGLGGLCVSGWYVVMQCPAVVWKNPAAQLLITIKFFRLYCPQRWSKSWLVGEPWKRAVFSCEVTYPHLEVIFQDEFSFSLLMGYGKICIRLLESNLSTNWRDWRWRLLRKKGVSKDDPQVLKNANLFDSKKTNGSSFYSQCVLFGGQALAVDHRNQGGAIVHGGRPLVFCRHSGRPWLR